MECRHTLVGLDDVIKRVHGECTRIDDQSGRRGSLMEALTDQEERELAETFLDSCGRAAEAIKHADMRTPFSSRISCVAVDSSAHLGIHP